MTHALSAWLLRDDMLIDPARRTVEVDASAASGGWLFTDQSGRESLRLSSIDVSLPLVDVLSNLDDDAA